jgi:acyl-CoA dehydrogenase
MLINLLLSGEITFNNLNEVTMSQDLEQFRAETRSWLEANCPAAMRLPFQPEDVYWGGRNATFISEDQKIWFERMLTKGWTVPHWPTEYGGGGLNKAENKILLEEMTRLKCWVPLYSFGVSMLGPVLLKYGSEELKREHLPKIVSGEIRWCQGYSEPGAGSDLAGLSCKAISDGDDYVVTGQKVWCSYGDKADWIFNLVRTDQEAKKQMGISFVLIDMLTPGVSVSPIKLISGSSPFCEVFFDQARVPKSHLVGNENEGWTYAKYLLTHEREMIGESFGLRSKEESLGDMAIKQIGIENGQLADSVLRADVAKLEINELAFAVTLERVKDEVKAGQGMGATSSMLKYYATELNKDRHEVMVSVAGMNGLAWEGQEFDEGALSRAWLRTKGNSIEGGTSEIQLNVISKLVLGLP